MAPVGAHLTDFGLARLVSTGSRLTRTGMALGTPEYMSPEQARGDVHDLTPATDVWGVGVVLYEMLAGRRAFEGDSPESVVEGVMLAEPPPLGPLRPDAPRGIERVVRVCLAKRPARRYPDAGALRDDLDRVLRDETPLARPPLARGARRALAGSVLGAGLVVLALAAVLGFRRAGPPEEPGPGVPEEAAEARALVLVARARTLRATAPEAGAALLAEAAALAPDHADRERWRLERGLLLWASGDPGAARAEWDRVPADRRERVASRLYLGLEALFGLRGRDAAAPLDEAAAAGGPESRLARGALAVLRMEWDAAREALREIPGWEAAILRGYIESAAPDGDPAVAVRELDAGLSEGIPLPWAFANRGLGRSRLGDSAGALADLERAIRSGGSTPPTHVNRGSVREQLGDTAGALEDYGTALGLDPGCAPAWNRRAVLRHRLGDPRGAFADVEEAIRLEPGAPHHLQTRALIREDLGDPAGAEEDLTAALAARPGSATLLYSRAVARQRAGDLAGALADYDASLRANPRQPQVLVNRAVVRGMLGDRAAALEDLGRAIALDPRDPKAFYNRANTLWDLGDLQAAEADYSRALELEPEEPDALGNRGEMRRRLGDLPGAERDLRAAVRIAPGKALFRVRLGLLLRDRRDWVGAAQALREGLARPDGSLPPGTAAQAREALAECEGRQGPVRR